MTVGQDLLRLELGGEKKDNGDKKDAAADKKETKDESAESKPKASESQPEPESKKPAQESKPAPKEESKPAPKPEAPKASSQESGPKTSSEGNREERRVRQSKPMVQVVANQSTGQDEPHASAYRRASEAVSKHRRLPYDFQRGRYVQHHGVP